MNSRDAEAAILALANPIVWIHTQYPSGKEDWRGEYQGREYTLVPPKEPDETDTEAYNRLWCILLRPGYRTSYASTFEAAKDLCQRYALTNDRNKLRANGKAVTDQGEWYRDEDMKAILALAGCESHPLEWQSVEHSGFTPRHFAAQGERGNYDVRWVGGRCWVVTFTSGIGETGTPAAERCFLTRTSAKQACCVHDVSGRWIGVLASPSEGTITASWLNSGSVRQPKKRK